ncbi:MAG: hypothetical protein GQ570_10400 [Helicobacteraceae bacterium]|nr:hypothetical protein [Helicobacteraceae bacterium]
MFNFTEATEFALLDTLIRIAMVVIASTLLFMSLRIRDKIAKIDFKESFEIIKKDPRALSTYYSTWVFVIGIITATLFA